LEVAQNREDEILTGDSLVVVLARAGAPEPLVHADQIKKLVKEDFGGPLHCLIIPGKLHFLEAEALVVLAGAPEDILP